VSPRRLWVGLAAIAYLALAPATAWAHANLDRADPPPGTQLDQSPTQLRLTFSEAVDGSFSRVQLLNTRGDAVDRGDSHVAPGDPLSLIVAVPDQLPDGVYTVAWRTLSAVDGHTVSSRSSSGRCQQKVCRWQPRRPRRPRST
jgi:copper transport protein